MIFLTKTPTMMPSQTKTIERQPHVFRNGDDGAILRELAILRPADTVTQPMIPGTDEP
jgi:hypothetical protein